MMVARHPGTASTAGDYTVAQPRVLVAEDDAVVGRDLELTLVDLGYDVPRRVGTGEEALAAARELAPDLVLMDIRMPGGMDGIEAARRIRAELSVPIVYLTAYSDEATVERAKETQPYGYLLKPFQQRELRTTLELAVHRSRLEKRDRLYRQTLASLDAAVLVVGARGGRGMVSEANEAVERIFGYPREELLGSTTAKLHFDDGSFRTLRAEIRRDLEQDGIFRGQHPLRRKDGSKFDAEITVTLLDGRLGIPGGTVVVIRDVSRRMHAEARLRESEERFRQLAERIEDVFWISTPGSPGQDYVSPAYDAIWGHPREDLKEHPRRWLDHVHADDRERVRQALPGQAEGTFEEVYRIVRPDGEVRWILDRAFPVRGSDGSVERVIGVAEDITHRKGLESQLLQSQKMEAVGQLAGGIAHDFNNLLTVVRSQSDLLLADLDPDDEVAQEVRVIRDASDRAADLTRQLLAFARKQMVRPRVIDLDDVIANMRALLERTLGEDITVEVDLDSSGACVRVDPAHIEQVIMNLAVNARDAMPDGGSLRLSTRVEHLGARDVRTEPGLSPGRHLRLEVSDTGVGMDDVTCRRIFEPFFTTKIATRGGRGSGLGLATVYGVVQQNGGEVRVSSRPGEGSSFIIHLPVTDERPSAPDPAEDPSTASTRVGTVLVVEDDQAVRDVARKLLLRAGMDVLEAGDVHEALAVLRGATPVHLVLSDFVLPGGTGLELWRQMRAERSDIPFVFMSGYSKGTRSELPPEVPFLQKPFSAAGLLEVVQDALASR